MVVLIGGFGFYGASEANAWVVVRRRVAPVRRVARAVLPPYGVRRVVYGPAVVRRPVVHAPTVYGYGPSVYFGY